MSHPQPLLHSTHADCTHSSTSSSQTPSAKCWSTRTGHAVSRSCALRGPQTSATRSPVFCTPGRYPTSSRPCTRLSPQPTATGSRACCQRHRPESAIRGRPRQAQGEVAALFVRGWGPGGSPGVGRGCVDIDFDHFATLPPDDVAALRPASYLGTDGDLVVPRITAGEGLVAVTTAALPDAVLAVRLHVVAVHGTFSSALEPRGGRRPVAGGVRPTGRRHQTSAHRGLVLSSCAPKPPSTTQHGLSGQPQTAGRLKSCSEIADVHHVRHCSSVQP
jgi:hypothetical protein